MTAVEIVRAFLPDAGDGGSPAGVVMDASSLTPEDMQRIAAKVDASETAFVLPSSRGAVKLRYFTPTSEVPVCGHATIAAFARLAEEGRFPGDDGIRRLTCETAAGMFNVDVYSTDGKVDRVVMTQQKPEIVAPRLMVGEVAPHLGIERPRIEKAGAPIQICTTGMRAVIVPVDTRETLAAIQPGPNLAALQTAKKAPLLIAWATVSTRPNVRIAQRVFAPSIGIPEDPATGMGAGALAGYLLANHLVPGTAPVTSIKVEQGAEVGKPSLLVCDVHVDPVMNGFRPTKVKVGGRAKRVATIEV